MSKLENAYALIIGVDFKQATDSVIKDAKAIYRVLSNEKLCGYKKENIKLLVDKKASKDNILEALDYFKVNTDENSSLLLYYSGHGDIDPETNDSYIIPFGECTRENVIFGKTLRKKLGQMKSKRMIILFDCCHSASFFDDKDETITQNFSNKLNHHTSNLEGIAQEIDDEQGMAIVASSQKDELSWGTLGNYSLFTTCLIEALKAKQKHFFADEYIRMVETVNYLFKRVPEMAKELKKAGVKAQRPYANLQMNNDFVISYIPEKLRANIVTNKFTSVPEVAPLSSKSGTDEESWIREKGNNLLLFIHGFSGESKGTFGAIPNMLQSDSIFDGWAMKPLGYSHFVQPELGKDIWAGILDVDKIAGFLKTSIINKFKNYDRIAIVAHSLGGLVAQKAILGLEKDDRNKISHLIMFGTPSNGISSKLLTKQWNTKYSEMSSDGEFITTLRDEWTKTFNDKYPFKLKVVASTDDEFVSLESCHGPFGQEYREFVNKKHLMIVKPKDEKDDAYSLILNTLTGSKFFNQYTNKEEINLTLGKYDSVVKELLPRKDDLDKRGLTQLIFALEGLERKDEVYDILNTHPLAQSNTDLMGIIGGRHKRDYLKTYSYKSSQLSREYYSKALQISVENEVHSQIYYHAINLAFLSIVTDPETGKSEMKKYANQALDATKHCDDDLWKFATVAEANMYLGNLDVAKEFYIKASENIPIREKLSMHTNAYAGYVALTNKDNDEFTQFLKERLLS